MSRYEYRIKGPRWAIIYGSNQGIEQFALEELYRKVQAFLPYVLEVYPAARLSPEIQQMNLILLGTAQDNPWIKEALKDKPIPIEPQGYLSGSLPSPWQPERRTIILAGSDANGVLYGVEDFIARILCAGIAPEKPNAANLRQAFDGMSDFWIQEHPRVANRGIWTWGYVIYDYHRFLDNMARLKMNMLTIWVDYPPDNIHDVIDYAHRRGIRLFLGFSWGWGMAFDIANADDRNQIKTMVLADFKERYTGLDMDGIYFQTLTEHNQTEINGQSVAHITCEMVNDVAQSLFELKPGLQIHFGLHATSIRERYTDLSDLDKRVTIVWEDAGVLPYTYSPILQRPPAGDEPAFHLDTLAETLAYSKKLATFRPGTEFAIVPKGWSNLDWWTEFDHHETFLLGVRDPGYIRGRCRQRQPHWDKINASWLKNYPQAVHFYREMLDCRPPKMTVTGLIEDGIFEERIQLSIAIFGETLWNPRREPEDILQLALSPYYREQG